jgi:hypothetical protein
MESDDPRVTSVVSWACAHVAVGLVNLTALLHPSVIFIGHDMSRAGLLTHGLLRCSLADRGAPSGQVLAARANDWVPAPGAVALALRQLIGGTTCQWS